MSFQGSSTPSTVAARSERTAGEQRNAKKPTTETNFLRYLQLECFRNELPDHLFSVVENSGSERINGSRIMENEFDLGETEEFEDIPGRPSTGD